MNRGGPVLKDAELDSVRAGLGWSGDQDRATRLQGRKASWTFERIIGKCRDTRPCIPVNIIFGSPSERTHEIAHYAAGLRIMMLTHFILNEESTQGSVGKYTVSFYDPDWVREDKKIKVTLWFKAQLVIEKYKLV